MTCSIPGMCSRSPACHDHNCPGHPREAFWLPLNEQPADKDPWSWVDPLGRLFAIGIAGFLILFGLWAVNL